LQDAIATQAAKDTGLNIRRMTEYIRNPDIRMGASFDFAIGDDGLMEIKNIDGMIYKTEWSEDEKGIQGPLHIECQVQAQLAVSGRDYCLLTALVGGNRLVQVKRTRDHAVIEAIIQKVKEFWASIESNTPPPPDYQADAEFIGKLFGYAEPGSVLNIVEDSTMLSAAQEYKRLGDIEKDAKEKREAIKAELLMKIGTAEKAIGDGFTISAGVQGPTRIEAYDRAGFRSFRINWKKEKKA
jgi:predicted phage-related endonuclease